MQINTPQNMPQHNLYMTQTHTPQHHISWHHRSFRVGVLPDSCYRLSLQHIHLRYKSCRATCYVTNLDPKTDTCKSTRPITCHNTTFTWLKHARPSTKFRGVIGAQCRGSYPTRVTVCPYNGYIGGTNPVVRRVMSLTWTHARMCPQL